MCTANIARLPNEVLEMILVWLDEATSTPKAKKDAFYALKDSSPLFSRLRPVSQALFCELHVFTTPASSNRLGAISLDPVLSRLVKKVIFHCPALSDPVKTYRDTRYDSLFLAMTQDERDAYREAYIVQQAGLESGLFTWQWANALSVLNNVRRVELTASDNPDQFMAVRTPTAQLCSSAESGKESTEWSQQLIRHLYPGSVVPYTRHDDFDLSDALRESVCPARAYWLCRVMRALTTGTANTLEELGIDGLLDEYVQFETFPTDLGLHINLKHLELSGLGSGLVYPLFSLSGAFEQLTRLRLVGSWDWNTGHTPRIDQPLDRLVGKDHLRRFLALCRQVSWYFSAVSIAKPLGDELLDTIANALLPTNRPRTIRTTTCLWRSPQTTELTSLPVPSLRILEIENFIVEHQRLARFLDSNPGLQRLSIRGLLKSNDMIDMMRFQTSSDEHPGLVQCDPRLKCDIIDFLQQAPKCECGEELCGVCESCIELREFKSYISNEPDAIGSLDVRLLSRRVY